MPTRSHRPPSCQGHVEVARAGDHIKSAESNSVSVGQGRDRPGLPHPVQLLHPAGGGGEHDRIGLPSPPGGVTITSRFPRRPTRAGTRNSSAPCWVGGRRAPPGM